MKKFLVIIPAKPRFPKFFYYSIPPITAIPPITTRFLRLQRTDQSPITAWNKC